MSCIRYPVDVKAVGLMQCRKQKNYMMFVSWSDQTNILIYRTFEDFKRFHKELKRKFPIESGSLKRSDRTLPRFKDANAKQRRSAKPDRCLEILKLLETYSQELLKTAAKISQGEDVIQFFKAQTQDLDPSFPENSVVIMPSDIGGEKKAQSQRRQQQPSCITWPQASHSYRCIETFETKDTKNKSFKVTKKEIVEVLIKDMTGWWLVENADKQIAWFPATYLEEIDVHKDIHNAFCSDKEGSLYFVVRAYESQKADELSLNNGVVVEVVRKSEDGWWLIRYNNCTGYLPSMCLQPYKNPHHKLQTIINCGLNISTPNLCSSLTAPQLLGEHRVQACSSLTCEEDLSSLRGRSRSLPRASSTPDLESDSTSLSSGGCSEQDGQLSWQPNLSRSLPEVEQARSPPLGHALAMHSTKSTRLTSKDRNDSGFVESSAADLSSSLTDPHVATCVPKVPARPSPQEILQRCSTVTKRAVQRSGLRSPAPACVLGGTDPALDQALPHH
ncbi:NADPH oxidase organizer 1 isoform X1 [Pezoporus wallicus]|uniref:NADPH oxidase organizer 1 isoform X1 n=2 Tax=Pezoporus wallicus TaxID=35540 RepID=UPI00254B10FF|nr:NADPH oxidase organizer 1 isoform X1 [Pezoporus wallicus]